MLKEGTGDIPAGLIFMAEQEAFVQYDGDGDHHALANRRNSRGGKGFERWADCKLRDKIYAQGNGERNFAVYDIRRTLERTAEVRKSRVKARSRQRWDPITNTYLTTAYGGNTSSARHRSGLLDDGTLRSQKSKTGAWATSACGIEGVYMIEGESGTAFTLRRTEPDRPLDLDVGGRDEFDERR